VCVAISAGLASAAVFTSTAAAQTQTAPGVSAKSVELGYIFSGTGIAGSSFKDAGEACQARIDSQNARDGLNGRKIDVQIINRCPNHR
jgi:hypothetical protein